MCGKEFSKSECGGYVQSSPRRCAERVVPQALSSVSLNALRWAHALDYSTDIKVTPEEVEAKIRSFY